MRDGAAALTHHIAKEMNELNLERCKCIPTNTPGADWRCLEALVRDDPSREKFKVRQPAGCRDFARQSERVHRLPMLHFQARLQSSDGMSLHWLLLPDVDMMPLSASPLKSICLCHCRGSPWCPGACPTRLRGTTGGGGCMAAWTGVATSPPV